MNKFKEDDKVVVWVKPVHSKSNSGLYGQIKDVIPVSDGDTMYNVLTENNQKFFVTSSYLTPDV